MSRRTEMGIGAGLLAVLVILRAWPFVVWPGAQFDSDQAVVGLMAKHISEGRAFPLYYYGQHYMLAVEAWLAAPVMLVMGPTVTALKLPLVGVNVAVVCLLLRIAVRDVGPRPALACLAVLPLALPAAGVAARVVEANGGNVEPWLYVLLLWVARHRPWLLGVILGVGSLHREFTLYGALALLMMESLRAWPTDLRTLAQRWTVVAIAALAVCSIATSLQPFANALGPGTTGADPALLLAAVDTVGGRICIDPAQWPARASLLVLHHLPRLIGGYPAPLADYGVHTGVFSGTPGLGLWVGLLTLAGLSGHAWRALQQKKQAPGGRVPGAGFPLFLVLVGLVSTLVYGFATCSDVRVETMRYNLLAVLIPVGALLMALRAWTAPPVRAGLAAAIVLWCAFNAADVLALGREYRTNRPPDQRQAVADALQARGVTVAWSSFRTAYHTTFLSHERVRVSANDFVRIREYADEARASSAPVLRGEPCERGVVIVPGLHLCPG